MIFFAAFCSITFLNCPRNLSTRCRRKKSVALKISPARCATQWWFLMQHCWVEKILRINILSPSHGYGVIVLLTSRADSIAIYHGPANRPRFRGVAVWAMEGSDPFSFQRSIDQSKSLPPGYRRDIDTMEEEWCHFLGKESYITSGLSVDWHNTKNNGISCGQTWQDVQIMQ